MTAPEPPNVTALPRRPSLMAAPPVASSDDDQGFSVSILSAVGGMSGSSTSSARQPGRQPVRSPASGHLLWVSGVALVALGLMAAAHLRQSPPAAPPPPPATAVLAPAVTPQLPSPAAASGVSAAEPETPGAAASVVMPELVASAVAPGSAASNPVTSNPFDKITAMPAPAAVRDSPRAAAVPARKPASAAASRTASPSTPTRDRDAELVAALMANADAGREIPLPASAAATAPKSAPLTTIERNRFAAELRQCQQRNPDSAAARDLCRAEACQTHGYAGRTKSCPAAAARAGRATTSPHGPSA